MHAFPLCWDLDGSTCTPQQVVDVGLISACDGELANQACMVALQPRGAALVT